MSVLPFHYVQVNRSLINYQHHIHRREFGDFNNPLAGWVASVISPGSSGSNGDRGFVHMNMRQQKDSGTPSQSRATCNSQPRQLSSDGLNHDNGLCVRQGLGAEHQAALPRVDQHAASRQPGRQYPRWR